MKNLLVAALLSVWLAGCASSTQGRAPLFDMTDTPAYWHFDSTSLMAYGWTLTAATDAADRPIADLQLGIESPLKVRFLKDTVSIRGGCNTQFGGYAIQGDTVRFQGLAATMMACDQPRMQLDTAVAQRIQGSVRARITGPSRAPVLRLTAANGDVLSFVGTREK